ncbi:MAG: DEAD/DEAH box helicase family protein [Chloroflexi bacterium]|nr:DEAD/DEAH box helicase family protein [Chloroflexota bacterium]
MEKFDVMGQMSLKQIHLPATMDTSTADMTVDFYVPALSVSVRYDRGVGFFSSGWLRMVAQGLLPFAANGGRARIITSPILSEADWDALQKGAKARGDSILHSALTRNLVELEATLEEDTLSALAWMVADEILTFKLALPQNKLAGGDFHDKFGVFTDLEGNQASFNGSPNESIRGTYNYESNKIFKSWEPAFAPLVDADVKRFERLWDNEDPNVRVYELPEAAQEQILRLRKGERPYPTPSWIQQTVHEPSSIYNPIQPAIPPHITLRDYQEEAITAWFDHDCRGLFEMATGTGKTITALAASARLYEREQQLAVIIAVPYQHLVDQWKEEAEAFGYKPILAYQSKSSWLDGLNHAVIEFNGRYRPFISVITTHTTFISPAFQAAIARLQAPSLIIADEAHHLGAERSRQNYPYHIPYRLALSATPDRWFDDEGTAVLRAYFGKTVFAFTLEEAIGVSLTPYYYYPHLVPLTDDEMAEYEVLSLKIARLVNQEDVDKQEMLKMLLIKRARLLNTAVNKLQTLSDLIDKETHLEHTLFYCAPGQIDDVMRLVGWEKGILVNQFTAEEKPKERQQLLGDFANGNLQALAAMKCLDEGVDVPSTRTAYFLASSSNPREFIQRRGRILRKFPGKEHSIVHDLIAVPPYNMDKESPAFHAERSIVRRELQRFKEFANPALNKHQALDVIWELADHYGLLDF